MASLVESDEDLKLGISRDMGWYFEDGSYLDYQTYQLKRFDGNWNFKRESAYMTVKEKEQSRRDLTEMQIFAECTKDSIDAVDYAFNSMEATRKIKQLRMKRLEKEYK